MCVQKKGKGKLVRAWPGSEQHNFLTIRLKFHARREVFSNSFGWSSGQSYRTYGIMGWWEIEGSPVRILLEGEYFKSKTIIFRENTKRTWVWESEKKGGRTHEVRNYWKPSISLLFLFFPRCVFYANGRERRKKEVFSVSPSFLFSLALFSVQILWGKLFPCFHVGRNKIVGFFKKSTKHFVIFLKKYVLHAWICSNR